MRMILSFTFHFSLVTELKLSLL
nr:unnamed protein product [Callosobruchus analis]